MSSTETMLQKVIRHARQGTLLTALRATARSKRPRDKADPDHYHGDVAKDYLAKRLQQKAWHIEQDIVRDLMAQMPQGSVILDVPFGTGRFVDMYLERNMTIYGVDISEDMLKVAREELGAAYEKCRIHLGSADSLPYENNFFDAVVCFRFFGLISFEMANRVLKEIHRVTKDKAIIRVPVRNESVTLAGSIDPNESVQGKLLESEVIAWFREYGFEVTDIRLIEQREKASYKVYVLKK